MWFLKSLSLFTRDTLLNMRRSFCADVLLYDKVRLRPEQAVTFAYIFPKIFRSDCAQAMLYDHSNVADYFLDMHSSEVRSGSRLHPEIPTDYLLAWAAHKTIMSTHPTVIRKIDAKFRSGKPIKDRFFRQYQYFDSLVSYLESEFKQFSVVRAPYDTRRVVDEKHKLSKLTGINFDRAWARSFFPLSKNEVQDQQDLEATDALFALQSLIELMLWKKSDPDTVLGEDQAIEKSYAEILLDLPRLDLPIGVESVVGGIIDRQFIADVSRGRHSEQLIKLTQMQIADLGHLSEDQILRLRNKSSSKLRRLLNKLLARLESRDLENAADAKREIVVSQQDLKLCRDIASVYRQFDRVASEQLEKEIEIIEKVRNGMRPIMDIQKYGGDFLFLFPLAKAGLNLATSWYGVPMHINYGYEDIAAVALNAAATGERISRFGKALIGDLIGEKVGLDFYITFRRFPKV
jgi:hypothetical protein